MSLIQFIQLMIRLLAWFEFGAGSTSFTLLLLFTIFKLIPEVEVWFDLINEFNELNFFNSINEFD